MKMVKMMIIIIMMIKLKDVQCWALPVCLCKANLVNESCLHFTYILYKMTLIGKMKSVPRMCVLYICAPVPMWIHYSLNHTFIIFCTLHSDDYVVMSSWSQLKLKSKISCLCLVLFLSITNLLTDLSPSHAFSLHQT